MALTDAQKAQVRRYLGFPDINREVDLRLEGAMLALHAEGEDLAVDLLAKLADIETRVTNALGDLRLKRVEDIEFQGAAQIQGLWSVGNRYAMDLSVLLDIRPRRMPFSTGRGGPHVLGRG